MIHWTYAVRLQELVFGSEFLVPGSWLFDLMIDRVRAVIKNGDGKRRETRKVEG